MQDRIIGTEDSVNLFIKEMNELLDTHEMSTNLGKLMSDYRFRWFL